MKNKIVPILVILFIGFMLFIPESDDIKSEETKSTTAVIEKDKQDKIPSWLFDYKKLKTDYEAELNRIMPDEKPNAEKYDGDMCFTGSCVKFEYNNGSGTIVNDRKDIMTLTIVPPSGSRYNDKLIEMMNFYDPEETNADLQLDMSTVKRWKHISDQTELSFFMNEDGTIKYIYYINPKPRFKYQ